MSSSFQDQGSNNASTFFEECQRQEVDDDDDEDDIVDSIAIVSSVETSSVSPMAVSPVSSSSFRILHGAGRTTDQPFESVPTSSAAQHAAASAAAAPAVVDYALCVELSKMENGYDLVQQVR